MTQEPVETTVFVVDDDDAVRDALCMLIESMGIQVKSFSNVQSFLNEYDASMPGCVVLDVRLPHVSGLELQEHLKRHGEFIPLIFISAHATIAMAVRTLKSGAIDFLEKPFDDQMLLDSIQKALKIDSQERETRIYREEILDHLTSLSKREDEVIRMLIQGKSNKVIAHNLGLSTKTVETHRAHIMRKLGVNSMAGLVWMALNSGRYQEVPDKLPFIPPVTDNHPLSLR